MGNTKYTDWSVQHEPQPRNKDLDIKFYGGAIPIARGWRPDPEPIKMTPDFTLDEIEEAQALIKELTHD